MGVGIEAGGAHRDGGAVAQGMVRVYPAWWAILRSCLSRIRFSGNMCIWERPAGGELIRRASRRLISFPVLGCVVVILVLVLLLFRFSMCLANARPIILVDRGRPDSVVCRRCSVPEVR